MTTAPATSDRRRLYVLLVILVVIGTAYYFWGPSWSGEGSSYQPPVGPAAAPPAARGAAPGRGARTEQMPVPLKLANIEEDIPDEPKPTRNLFQWGMRPVPPPPPPPPPQPYVPPPPPPPPPPPQVPLKLNTIVADPYQPGRCRAYVQDTNTARCSRSPAKARRSTADTRCMR
jgi:hypothetical protein